MDPRDPIPENLDLGAFAAGEASPEEAEAIRARAARDPAFAAEVEVACRVEAALAQEGLLPVPLGLLARVRDDVRAEALRAVAPPPRIGWSAAAVAAVLALFLGVLPALFGVDSIASAAFSPDAPERIGAVAPEPVADAAAAIREGTSALAFSVPKMSLASVPEAAEAVPGGSVTLLAAGAVLVLVGLILFPRIRGGMASGREIAR